MKVAVCLFFAIALVGTQQTVWTANTLVSQWKLDEGTGTTTRDTVASRTATLTNGATWTTGKGSAAVSLDGSNDYIKLPSLDVTGSKLTLMAWVKHSSWATGVAQRFISKAVDSSEAQSYWTIGQTNNGQNRLFFRLKSGNVTRTLIASSGTLPLNTWYHVAATYDGTKMRLYLNGTEVGSMAKSGYVARSSTVPVAIGRSPEGSNYLRGAIDDVRIYSSAVSAYDISRVVAAASSTVAPTNKAPTVSLSSPAAGASFAAGTTVTVSATAADTDGTIARVQFYDGSTLIGSDTSSPYSVSWPSVAAGSHTLKAVATDNKGATTTSATRTVTATTTSGSNTPPAVSLTAPSAGAVFNIGLSITLSATASDSNGSVTRVDFYRDSTLIGTDTTSPYSVIWLNAPLGNYALTAVARDNAGAMTVSSTRDITVKSATLPTKAVFTPSSNHATAVDRYVLEVFTAGANTTVANPVATRDLGKPAIVSGSISVDISSTILALSPGNYVATVTAVGDVGSTQSAASPQFTR